MRFSSFLASLALAVLAAVLTGAAAGYNDAPVIGIFAQPLAKDPEYQYLAASYVKWLESAGARVVPIPYNYPIADMTTLFSRINGLLLPGGGAELPKVVSHALSLAEEANANGDYFPVWGTCMGFQWVSMHFARNHSLLTAHKLQNTSVALDFTGLERKSRLFGGMTADQRGIFSSKALAVTMNNHNWGVSTTSFDRSELAKSFRLLSTNIDVDGGQFVSTIEHATWPVYAVQWHPEKNNFEWSRDEDGTFHEAIAHSAEAVWASQQMANFFVNETRNNGHKFPHEEEHKALIYNYNPTYTADSFVQRYIFPWVTK